MSYRLPRAQTIAHSDTRLGARMIRKLPLLAALSVVVALAGCNRVVDHIKDATIEQFGQDKTIGQTYDNYSRCLEGTIHWTSQTVDGHDQATFTCDLSDFKAMTQLTKNFIGDKLNSQEGAKFNYKNGVYATTFELTDDGKHAHVIDQSLTMNWADGSKYVMRPQNEDAALVWTRSIFDNAGLIFEKSPEKLVNAKLDQEELVQIVNILNWVSRFYDMAEHPAGAATATATPPSDAAPAAPTDTKTP